jgi:hypothetical protein
MILHSVHLNAYTNHFIHRLVQFFSPALTLLHRRPGVLSPNNTMTFSNVPRRAVRRSPHYLTGNLPHIRIVLDGPQKDFNLLSFRPLQAPFPPHLNLKSNPHYFHYLTLPLHTYRLHRQHHQRMPVLRRDLDHTVPPQLPRTLFFIYMYFILVVYVVSPIPCYSYVVLRVPVMLHSLHYVA